MKTTAALIACLATGLPATAQTAEDIATVNSLANELERITIAGDIAASLQFLPPTLLDKNAEAQGMTRAEFDAMMTESMTEMAQLSSVRESVIDTTQMVWQALPDGTLFAIIPTRNVLEVTLNDDEAPMVIEENSTTLALQDQGAWRVVRAGSATQQDSLRNAFPWLGQVDLPVATTKVLEQ
ncbi:hypothetical protein [Paracoccus xiamenensis]|uniref:hypothetical protein n=1 Tax=Paracoccus xiamenensis TaxID=2714901 RepID=UPI00140AD874|nr:hypothetical protein [Paracoccus xiamenensis]NHF71934.1 hypothetical protein [Paracoccus xiamenensis]